MSNEILARLPGMTLDVDITQEWDSTLEKAASGREYSVDNWSYPDWTLKIKIDHLDEAQFHLSTLFSFYGRHRGRGATWLYESPSNRSVVDQIITPAAASGSTLFTLIAPFWGLLQPIYFAEAGLALKKNGSTLNQGSDFQLEQSRFIRLNQPTAAGDELTWSGDHLMRCRFLDDKLTAKQFAANLSSSGLSFRTSKV